MRIGVLNLTEYLQTEYVEPLVMTLLAGVSDVRQERICRYFRLEDRLRSLAAEHLLIAMLKDEGILAESELPLSYHIGPHGKPEILGHPEIFYNLSHAGELVVCALADQSSVGVDVQDWRGIKEGVARRCFTDFEREWLSGFSSEFERERAFYQLWTLKESFIKVTGIGMSFPMKRVEFTIEEEVTVSQDWDENAYYAKLYEIPEHTGKHYGLAVCSEEVAPSEPEWYQLKNDGAIKRIYL